MAMRVGSERLASLNLKLVRYKKGASLLLYSIKTFYAELELVTFYNV